MTYPTIRPALTLDFQKSKKLDPRITFTRSSTATYLDAATGLIKTAPSGVARFEKEGLLNEEARTNLAENSEDFSLWTAQNSTVLTAQGTAPDGTNTAFKIQENTSTISHSIREPSNSTWSGAATLSCYVKPAGRNFAYMGFTGVSQTSITFDLVNKVSSYQGTNVTSGSVEDAGNGWLRIVAVFSSSITSGRATVGPAESDSSGGLNYTGDGSSGILAWGAQLEAGSFPTSYIPTTSSTVTRAADTANVTGTNFSRWYRQGEGSFVTSADRLDGLPGLQFTVMTTNGFRLPEFSYRVDGIAQVYSPAVGSYLGSGSVINAKFGWAFDGTGASRAINGAGSSVTNSNITDTNTALYLGNYINNATLYRLCGHITRLTYYPERVSDASLQELTS